MQYSKVQYGILQYKIKPASPLNCSTVQNLLSLLSTAQYLLSILVVLKITFLGQYPPPLYSINVPLLLEFWIYLARNKIAIFPLAYGGAVQYIIVQWNGVQYTNIQTNIRTVNEGRGYCTMPSIAYITIKYSTVHEKGCIVKYCQYSTIQYSTVPWHMNAGDSIH